jgi:ATP-dependent Clp protease ATP-binding subunit ClpC
MFERYTETSRKAIFFARYEASQAGSEYIETEHLLLGLLRTDEALTLRLLKPEGIASIQEQIHKRFSGKKTSTSVDLPLSRECKRVLAHGDQEAIRRSHEQIEPHHLLLGLLREEDCVAARMMLEHGVTLPLVETVLSKPERSAPPG